MAEQLAWERRRRLLRRAAVGAGAIACFVVVILLILSLRGTETGIIFLAEDVSDEVFPLNPQPDRDLSALKSVTDQQDASLFRSDPLELLEVQQTHKLPDALDQFRDKDVLVLYINVLSGRDGKGPFLVPGDARADDASSYYRFDGEKDLDKGLWPTLKRHTRPEQKKLVILDVNHVTADWRMGLLANDAVRNLQNAAKEYEIDNLVILASCRPGERSWTSTDLEGAGQSVFGHYLARALSWSSELNRGEADIDGDENIDLRELFEYVNIHTHEWVDQNRDPGGQHPMLLYPSYQHVVDNADNSDVNFTVAEVVKDVAPVWPLPENHTAALSSAEQRLHALYQRRDRLLGGIDDSRRARAYWHDPVLWRTAHWQLRRAEERLLHGYTDLAILNKAETTLRELEQRQPDDPFAPLNFDDELRANVARHSNFAMHEAAARDPLPPNFEQGPEPPEAFRDRFEAVRSTLPEVHLADVLRNDFPARYPKSDLPPHIVEAAIQTRRAGEMAASGPLGTLSGVEAFVAAGDTARREAEDRLFLGGGAQTIGGVREQQENLATARQKFDEARRWYTTAIEIARHLHSAQLVRDRLLAELPELARWAAFRDPPQDAQAETDVVAQRRRMMDLFQNEVLVRLGQGTLRLGIRDLAAVDAKDERIDALKGLHGLEGRVLLLMAQALELTDRLQSPTAHQPDQDPLVAAESVAQYAKQVEDLLRYTQHQLEIAADQLLQPTSLAAQPQFRDWRKVHGFLQCSLLAAEQRQRLRERLDDYGDKLHTQFAPPTVNQELENRTPATRTDPAPHDALWHAFWGIQVLALAGHDAEPLWRDWNNARAALPQDDVEEISPADAQAVWDRLARLGDDLRGDTTRGLASMNAQIRRQLDGKADGVQQAREAMAQADRLARGLDGYDAARLGRDPAEELRNFDIARLCLSQAERYLEDYWAGWYDRRVEECIAAAQAASNSAAIARQLNDPDYPDKGLQARFARRQKARLTVHGPPYVVQFPQSLVAQVPLDVTNSRDVPDGIAAGWMHHDRDPVLEGTRAAVELAGGQPASVKVELRKADANGIDEPCQEVELRVPAHLWYRGHMAARDPAEGIIVIPCPPRGIEQRYRPPAATGQLVLAGRDVRRPIVFVLDCSYSMRDGKFEKALAALKQTIQTLHDNPQEGDAYRVALIFYGHRLQKLDGQPVRRNPRWPGEPPGHDDPFSDVEVVHPVGPLSKTAFDRIQFFLGLDRERLGPWGNTPLNLSILNALDYATLAPGASIVAITDGAANDNEYQGRNAELKKQLRLKGKSVDLHIVGFALQEELPTVRSYAKDLAAEFHEAPDGETLARRLIEALNLGDYSVLLEDDPGNSKQTRLGQPLQVGAGRYTLRLPDGRTLSLPMAGGEHLRAEFKFDQLLHEKYFAELGIRSGLSVVNPRLDEATPPASGPAPPEDAPTHLAYRKFELNNASRTAEFRLSLLHLKEHLFVHRPPELDFDIFPKSEESSPKLRTVDIRWSDDKYQSIPTWDVDVEDWPTGNEGELAVVRAYWKMERTPADVLEPKRFNDVRNGIPLTLPGGSPCEVTAEYQSQARKAVVKLRFPPTATLDENANRELATLRVELGYDRRGFQPISLPYRSEFLKGDSLTVAFDVEDSFDPGTIRVAITSLEARKANAFEAVLDGIRYRRGF